MDHREELITLGTQDEDKQNKNTICVGQHYTQDKDTHNTTQHVLDIPMRKQAHK